MTPRVVRLLLVSLLLGVVAPRHVLAQQAPPPALGKGATESMVARYQEADHWVQKAVVMLSLHHYWHPAGAQIVLDALRQKDPRMRAFGIETLLRGEEGLLPKVASTELVDELVKRQLSNKNKLYHKRVLEVLARIAPDANAKDKRSWARWWMDQAEVFTPQEWTAKEQPKAGAGGTAAVAQRAFDLYQSGLELMVCIDSTGSMQPTIDALAAALDQMVDILGGISPKLRLGIVHYKDYGELGKVGAKVIQPLGKNIKTARKKLGKLRAMGGGDLPEAVMGGLEVAFSKKTKWSQDANKLVILIGDAPPRAENLERAIALSRNAYENPGTELGKPTTGKNEGKPVLTSAIAVNLKFGPQFQVPQEFFDSQKKMREDFEAIAKAGGGVYASVEFEINDATPKTSKDKRKLREAGGGEAAGSATRTIVEHILVLSFGEQHRREMHDFLNVFYDYKNAGLFK